MPLLHIYIYNCRHKTVLQDTAVGALHFFTYTYFHQGKANFFYISTEKYGKGHTNFEVRENKLLTKHDNAVFKLNLGVQYVNVKIECF